MYTKLELQITFNTGNYTSVKLGGEFTPDESLTTEQNLRNADAELRAAFAALYKSKAEPEQAQQTPATETPKERKHITFNDPLFQKIVNKISREKTPESVVREHYTFDERAEKVLLMAFNINNINNNEQNN